MNDFDKCVELLLVEARIIAARLNINSAAAVIPTPHLRDLDNHLHYSAMVKIKSIKGGWNYHVQPTIVGSSNTYLWGNIEMLMDQQHRSIRDLCVRVARNVLDDDKDNFLLLMRAFGGTATESIETEYNPGFWFQ